ncbi:spore coat protein YsxE [Bacillus timonensis]|uniref:Spore coat protein YsxE n=1 Tax=Bacillus timonensis TaxID=1033734 RepID=A0A4S3Q033_9BACI|nr:spore coat protein YsxE [Bacillus timonensis]THE15285.1 spore coat protein YsxE [Bacillus timonensis]
MNKIDISSIGPILKKYNLKPLSLERFGKITKVVTDKGIYALKSISHKINPSFPTFLQQLFQQGYTRAVPIYPTVEGKYLIYHNHKFHYLMPWLKSHTLEHRGDHYHAFFKEIARIHLTTVSKQQINNENEIKGHYETIIKKWEERNQFLERFVVEAEAKWYMSPFELQFCTYFYETSLASSFARTQLEKWHELMVEKKSYRTALTLNNLSDSHFLYDDSGKGYLSNFEKVGYASPTNDLVSLYFRILKTYPIQCTDCLEWLETYQSRFPLREEEFYLFLSHLTYPEPIYRCVRNYSEHNQRKSEREHVQALQRAYWLTKNIEFVSVKLLEAEHQQKEQEEESHTE